jgi:hypothetical protein
VLYRHANDPLPPLPDRLAHLRPLHDALLAKTAEGRPASAAAVVATIDTLLASVAA